MTSDKPTDEKKLSTWIENDIKAQEIIVTRVDEKVMGYLSTCQSSKEMWEKLATLYEPSSKVSVHLIQQRFFNLRFEEPVIKFITELEEISNKLKSMKEAPSEKMLITKILMSLPEKYKHFISAWESVPDKQQSLKELTSRLLIEEERCGQESGAGSSAFVSRSNHKSASARENTSVRRCFVCNKEGHFKRDCKERKCYRCNQNGHLARDCNTVSTVTKGYKNAFIMQEFTDPFQFIMDSGASEHMTYNKELLINFRKIDKYVIVGDGEKLKVEGIGDIEFEAYNGNEYIPSVMYNVLYVPKLYSNLFSLVSAVDHGYMVLSGEKCCKFLFEGSVVAQATRINNLYLMDFKFQCNNNLALISLSVWHERLAHQNYRHVKEILDKNNVKYEGQIEQCTSCIKGKQHRLPFHDSESRAKSPGELIHGDLCGPMETKSLGGSSYFLLLKDDYSNFRFVYFLKRKSETKDRIAEFLEQFENEFECRVKRFRSDGGGEFMNRDVEGLFKKKGIVHETTVAYTPEQNGRIEREMRTVVESARTMIIKSGLGKEVWAEAVDTAVYTINRTGSSPVKGKTPYELIYGRSFGLNIFRTFGSKVYTHIPKQRRQKWDPKSEPGCFVGYGTKTKGYRVWLQGTGQVEVFRDVVFIEKKDVKEGNKEESEAVISNESWTNEEENPKIVEGERNSGTEGVSMQDAEKEVESEEVEKNKIKEKNITQEAQKNIEEVLEVSNEDEIQIKEAENEVNAADKLEEYLDAEVFEEDDEIEERRTRSGRIIKRPNWMKDYETGFLAREEEQLSYEEAISGKDRKNWIQGIENELEALKRNNTWIETDLPEGQKSIDTKWVFKIKNDNGKMIYKARLVARGFKQDEKFDHSEIYAPVAKLPTLRVLLAIASKFDLDIQQMDVKSAFLNGNIEEEVYLKKPKGMEDDGKVLKLCRSIYGLKKSPRYWNKKFDNFMIQEGFCRSKSDYCLYFKKDIKFYVLLYVDDIILISEDSSEIEKLKNALKENFDMKDMNGVTKYLGININVKEDCIELDQEDYLRSILKKYNMENCKPVSTPIEPGLKIEKKAPEDKELVTKCRQLIGSLMYAMLGTRPDICFAVSYLSRFQDCANEDVWKGLKRILRYVKGTIGLKLIFKKGEDIPLVGFTDADWGGDQHDRKSTSGYIMMVYGCTVSWSSTKQQCVSLSSTEAEYIALAKGISEGCWIKNLMCEINLKCNKIEFFEDNQSAIHISKNPEQHKRMKHVDLKYHFVRDKVEQGIVNLKYIPTDNQLADICTKPLARIKFEKFRKQFVLC